MAIMFEATIISAKYYHRLTLREATSFDEFAFYLQKAGKNLMSQKGTFSARKHKEHICSGESVLARHHCA